MSEVTIAAAAAWFGRDLEACFETIGSILDRARHAGARLVVLPEAALGGYLTNLSGHGSDVPAPPALDLDGPEVQRLAALAADLVVCAGLCEVDRHSSRRFNTAVCVHNGSLLGVHRKVHLPLREDISYDVGDRFQAFDTPVGRMGMLVCYDKAFPESARCLALDGARIIACLSAWPASRTAPTPNLADDRWTQRFDLFDRSGALHNQVVWVASNQTGSFGSLRFVGSAKVVGPGGEVLATTGPDAGEAIATVDLDAAIGAARRIMPYLQNRRPDTYGALETVSP